MAKAKNTPSSNVYVATRTAHVTVDGQRVLIRKDTTRVREGHDLIEAYPAMFKRIDEDLRFDTEAAIARPHVPDQPPTTARAAAADAEQLKGEALDKALEDAGLSKTGTADEKRARLAEHAAQNVSPDGTVTPADDEDDDEDDVLKGEALDAALEEAGLSKTGTADEKRARLAEHANSES